MPGKPFLKAYTFHWQHGRATRDWEQTIHSFFHQQGEGCKVKQYNFIFQPLEIRDNDHRRARFPKEAPTKAEEVGNINVYAYLANKANKHTWAGSMAPEPPSSMPHGPLVMEGELGETVDCFTSFDECGAPANDRYYKNTPVNFHDDDERPFAIDKFRYRTNAGLVRELGNAFISHPAGNYEPTTIADAVRRMSNSEVRDKLREVLEGQPALAVEYGVLKAGHGRYGTPTQSPPSTSYSQKASRVTPTQPYSSTPYNRAPGRARGQYPGLSWQLPREHLR